MKNITRQSWDIILMPDTVIYWVNLIGKYQQELLVFTYCKDLIIVYDYVKFTGVDWGGDENEAPSKIDNGNYLDYKEYQEEVHTEQEEQSIKQHA